MTTTLAGLLVSDRAGTSVSGKLLILTSVLNESAVQRAMPVVQMPTLLARL
jgi:hypothetical protein